MSIPSTLDVSSAATATALDTHSNRVDLIETVGGRILCLADVRGSISSLNALALEHNAIAIIHTGDFGYLESSSLPGISDRTLRHLVQYSTLITPQFRSQLLAASPSLLRSLLDNPPRGSAADLNHSGSFFPLSEFPKLLTGELKLVVPVYAVWGACEDIAVLEKIRLAAPSPSTPKPTLNRTTGPPSYSIPNLTVLDEATTRVLLIGGVRLRLFGLGGAVVSHKLFDNGVGKATIAGGGGTMWTTVLQIGELVDTAQKVYDPTETRVLISHASPGREGLISQLSLVLKADLTISAGLHFRYGASYNEFSVQQDPDSFKQKLESSAKSFNEVWDSVRSQVETVIDANQRGLLTNALAVANRVPTAVGGTQVSEEMAWKNTWNWNLPDASFGSLVLDIRDGRIGTEMKSQGFNFAYRQTAPPAAAPVLSSAPATNPTSLPAPVSSAFPLSTTGELVKPIASNITERKPAPFAQSQGQNTRGASGQYPHLPYHPENIRQQAAAAAAAGRGLAPASGTPVTSTPGSTILPPTGPRADSGFQHTQGPLSVGSRYKGNASWGPSTTAATVAPSTGNGNGGGGNYRKPSIKPEFDTSAPTYSSAPAPTAADSPSPIPTLAAAVAATTGGWLSSSTDSAPGGGVTTKAPYVRPPRQQRDRDSRSTSFAGAGTKEDSSNGLSKSDSATTEGGATGGESNGGEAGRGGRGRGRGGARSSRGRGGMNGEPRAPRGVRTARGGGGEGGEEKSNGAVSAGAGAGGGGGGGEAAAAAAPSGVVAPTSTVASA